MSVTVPKIAWCTNMTEFVSIPEFYIYLLENTCCLYRNETK